MGTTASFLPAMRRHFAGATGVSSDGGLDLDLLKREVARGLVAHQHGDLGDELAELLDAGVLVAQDGQLVLDQRVVEYAYFAHISISFIKIKNFLKAFPWGKVARRSRDG